MLGNCYCTYICVQIAHESEDFYQILLVVYGTTFLAELFMSIQRPSLPIIYLHEVGNGQYAMECSCMTNHDSS